MLLQTDSPSPSNCKARGCSAAQLLGPINSILGTLYGLSLSKTRASQLGKYHHLLFSIFPFMRLSFNYLLSFQQFLMDFRKVLHIRN